MGTWNFFFHVSNRHGVVLADCVQVATRRDAGICWPKNYVLI